MISSFVFFLPFFYLFDPISFNAQERLEVKRVEENKRSNRRSWWFCTYFEHRSKSDLIIRRDVSVPLQRKVNNEF